MDKKEEIVDLEDYCRLLREHLNFGSEFIVKATKPPSYIPNLKTNNQQDPIIIIYKEGNRNDKLQSKLASLALISGVEDSFVDLSVTGQPLECPFDSEQSNTNDSTMIESVHESEEHFHNPLSMLQARKCLSVVNLKLIPPVPVWILTAMSDRNKIFLLGTEIESGWRTRSWAIAHTNQIEKMPIEEMIKNFEQTFRLSSGHKVTSEVCCVFEIKDQPGMAKFAKCHIEVNWKKPCYEVPIAQADTSLIVHCNVGGEESQISRWWKQLNLLHEYLQIIKQLKEKKEMQVTYHRDTIRLPSFKPEQPTDEKEKQALASRVLELLQRSDSMSVCRQPESHLNVTSALNSTIHELLTDKQKGQDLTDRLWTLLIEAETYHELAECFHLIMREVRKQAVKPYIFTKNRTRIASLIRSLRTSHMDLELMLEPLELLVEMGLEKLKRDYMFMFLASQIASEESLSIPKLQSFSEVNDWQSTVETWLRWLAQLHTVLELVSVIHTTMNTSVLVQFTSLALSTYVSNNSAVSSLEHLINNHSYELRAPIISKEVKNFIEGDRTFYKWMLKLSATASTNKVTSTYILLQQSPFPQKILMELDDTLNNSEILTDTMIGSLNSSKLQLHEKYCYIQMCSTSDKLPS